VAHLEAAAIPVAPIWNVEQALNSPQYQHRGVLQAVEDPQLPGLRLPSQPLQFSAFERTPVMRAPRLGEHTELTLSEVLGLASEKIAELRALGVFGR
jgi:CoA:oxalate CoA-transferase